MRLRDSLSSFLVLAVLLSTVAAPVVVSAQDDAVTRLRARLASAPQDSSRRCELAFALVGVGTFEEARTLADASVVALDALPRPLPGRTRNTLAACLYNRGRAHEGLSHPTEAATDYVRSLALRTNATILTRLEALAPGMRRDLPASALVALDRRAADGEGGVSLVPDAPIVRVTGTEGPWQFVAARVSEQGGFTSLAVYAIRWRGDVPAVFRLDEWTQDDNSAGLRVGPAQTMTVAGIGDVAVVAASAAGGGTCGRMDGFMDFEHEVTILVALGGAHPRSRVLVTSQSDCSEPVHMGIRVTANGVSVTSSRGGELDVGTHAIASLLQ